MGQSSSNALGSSGSSLVDDKSKTLIRWDPNFVVTFSLAQAFTPG
jgi:hypothetical protein